MTGHEPTPRRQRNKPLIRSQSKTYLTQPTDIENRFSPGPAGRRNQAPLRHPERSIYRCFLTDLAGFTNICRAGPDYADRQDRKKTGPSHSNIFSTRRFPLYSRKGDLSRKVFANKQAIFLFRRGWNLCMIRHDCCRQRVSTVTRLLRTIRRNLLRHSL